MQLCDCGRVGLLCVNIDLFVNSCMSTHTTNDKQAYNELFLLPLPARYVRSRAESLLLQGKEEEQAHGRRRRGRGDEGNGQQEQLRRRSRRARAMALHYVTVRECVCARARVCVETPSIRMHAYISYLTYMHTETPQAALDEFFSSASAAAAAASSTPTDPSNHMEDEGWVGLVAHMRAAARDPRAVAEMHAAYLARRRRRALLAGGRGVRVSKPNGWVWWLCSAACT